MPVVTLDSEQLQKAVKETLLQVARGIAEAECESQLQVRKEYDVQFTATVVLRGGLNAVTREQKGGSVGEKVSITVDDAVTEITKREGVQQSKQQSESANSGEETQTNSQEESNEQKSKGTSKEESTGKSSSKSTSKAEDTGTQEDKQESTQEQASDNVQSNGSTQETSTQYVSS
jgi:hypothetical protein